MSATYAVSPTYAAKTTTVTERASTTRELDAFRDARGRRRPRLLDLFCGQGGAGAGYWRAGFDVVGVDQAPQPYYPFEFIQADAIEFLSGGGADGFDAVHASPPCQLFSTMRAFTIGMGNAKDHQDLIEPVRELLRLWGGPYMIENVPGAPLEAPVKLCGSAFGLNLRRHRLFESNVPLMVPPCAHGWQEPRFPVRLGQPNSRSNGRDRVNPLSAVITVVGNSVLADVAREAMEMPWATRDGCSQAIPPAYTEMLGVQLAEHVARVTEVVELAPRPGAQIIVTKQRPAAIAGLAGAARFVTPREVLSDSNGCETCGNTLERAGTGRRRRFCDATCRQRAHRRAA